MPEISRFYGIVIRMFYEDHSPPHFHASYGDDQGIIDIRSLSLIAGSLPPRALGLVIEWGAQNREDLLAVWGEMRQLKPPRRIAPLP